MPSYDFLDPNQVNEYRAKAKEAGWSYGDIERNVRFRQQEAMKQQQIGLDIGKQQLEGMKIERDLLKLQDNKEENQFSDMSEFENKMLNARIAGGKVLNRFETEDVSIGPIATRLQKIGEKFGSTKGTSFRSELAATSAQLFNALAGAAQSPAELEKLQKMVPSETDQESVAQEKLKTMINLLDAQMQVRGIDTSSLNEKINQVKDPMQQPGIDLQQAEMAVSQTPEAQIVREDKQPAFNMQGELAKPGDLIRDAKTGELVIYGEPQQETKRFKQTKEGGDVEGGLIKWLADSEFLPISGSVVGSIVGGTSSALATLGIGSVAGGIAGGAAGATAGKTIQQGLRELLDPEAQDFSDMAEAVLIEGVTDGILGGAMFGVGAVAKPVVKGVAGKMGLKILIGEGSEQAVKAMGKEALGEGVEAGVKEGGQGVLEKKARDLTARGLGVKPSVEQARYASSTGGRDLVADIMEKFGIPKSGKALQEAAEASSRESSEKLTGLLANKTAPVDEVVKELEKVKSSGMFEVAKESGVEKLPKADFGAGVKKIDEYLTEIKAYGDEIPLENLNEIKKRMQKSFGKSLETSSLSKGIVQDASTSMRKYIEKFHPEIAGTNREKQLSYMARNIGERMDQKKSKSFFQFSDLVIGASNPVLLAGKKGVDSFTGAFSDPLVQARIINEGLKIAAANGNKQGVRNVLRFASKLGISFGLSPNAISKGVQGGITGAGASAITEGITNPGLDLEQAEQPQDIQPGFMYR